MYFYNKVNENDIPSMKSIREKVRSIATFVKPNRYQINSDLENEFEIFKNTKYDTKALLLVKYKDYLNIQEELTQLQFLYKTYINMKNDPINHMIIANEEIIEKWKNSQKHINNLIVKYQNYHRLFKSYNEHICD